MNEPKNGFKLDVERLKSLIKSELSRQNLTIQNLVELTDIPRSTITSFLDGKSVPAFDRVYAICAALGISMDGLSGDELAQEPVQEPSAHETALYGAQYVPDMKEMHQRELDQLSESGNQALESLRQAHAAEVQAKDHLIAELKRNLRLWHVIALVLVGLLCVWFVWDVTNGSRGLIRYDAARLYPYGSKLFLHRG